MSAPEMNRSKIIRRLQREGWVMGDGGGHDRFTHPDKVASIHVPRHAKISIGVAKSIGKAAGWR